MGSPSQWISGPLKWYFRRFEKKIRKIIDFQPKFLFYFFMIIFVPKRSQTDFRQNLLLFLPFKPIKTGRKQPKQSIFGLFSEFW